jgi:hypothetical protein
MLASSEKRAVRPRWQRCLRFLVQSSLLPKQFSTARRSILSRLKIARAYSIIAQDASLVVTLAIGSDPRERDVVWINDTKKSFRTVRVGKMAAKPSVSLFRYLDPFLPPDAIAFFVRYGPVLAYPGPDKVGYRLLCSDWSVQ